MQLSRALPAKQYLDKVLPNFSTLAIQVNQYQCNRYFRSCNITAINHQHVYRSGTGEYHQESFTTKKPKYQPIKKRQRTPIKQKRMRQQETQGTRKFHKFCPQKLTL
jgi:hypothetical protein